MPRKIEGGAMPDESKPLTTFSGRTDVDAAELGKTPGFQQLIRSVRALRDALEATVRPQIQTERRPMPDDALTKALRERDFWKRQYAQYTDAATKAGFVFSVGNEGLAAEHNPDLAKEVERWDLDEEKRELEAANAELRDALVLARRKSVLLNRYSVDDMLAIWNFVERDFQRFLKLLEWLAAPDASSKLFL